MVTVSLEKSQLGEDDDGDRQTVLVGGRKRTLRSFDESSGGWMADGRKDNGERNPCALST